MDNDFAIRVRRATSWFECAAREPDKDVAFILYWIAFNASYGSESLQRRKVGDLEVLKKHLRKLIQLDGKKDIRFLLWDTHRVAAENLLNNEYLYRQFWRHHLEGSGRQHWKVDFEASKTHLTRAWQNEETASVTCELFERLYTLRNQLLHGGATWKSSFNRSSVNDGASIMGPLVKTFTDIMRDNREVDWGRVAYRPGLQGRPPR